MAGDGLSVSLRLYASEMSTSSAILARFRNARLEQPLFVLRRSADRGVTRELHPRFIGEGFRAAFSVPKLDFHIDVDGLSDKVPSGTRLLVLSLISQNPSSFVSPSAFTPGLPDVRLDLVAASDGGKYHMPKHISLPTCPLAQSPHQLL